MSEQEVRVRVRALDVRSKWSDLSSVVMASERDEYQAGPGSGKRICEGSSICRQVNTYYLIRKEHQNKPEQFSLIIHLHSLLPILLYELQI